ncbi:hypothetical protein [Streptomyces sp. CT34]|nr:hypothetical protein [Streptomyces sp. CT34]
MRQGRREHEPNRFHYDETKRKFATGQSLTPHLTVGEWVGQCLEP